MKRNGFLGVSAFAAVLGLLLSGGVASAQQKAPDAPAKAPAAKKVPAKKPPSPCQGLDQNACSANVAECNWIGEATITKGARKGQKNAAHCQKKPVKKAEKAPAKAAPKPAEKK